MDHDDRRRLTDRFLAYADAREFYSEAECDGLWAGIEHEMNQIQLKEEKNELDRLRSRTATAPK